LEGMRDASQKELRFMDHDYTKHIVGKSAVLEEFSIHVIGKEGTETD